MKLHRTDLLALLGGLACLLTGGAFLVVETAGTTVDAAFATSVVLIVLGAVALVATLTPRRRAAPGTETTAQRPEGSGAWSRPMHDRSCGSSAATSEDR